MSVYIYVIAAMGMMALIASAYSNFIPVDVIIGSKLRNSIETGFFQFEKAVSEYQDVNRQYVWVEDCPPNTPSGDPSCVYDREIDPNNNGKVDVTQWESQLIPKYLRTPVTYKNFSWSMGDDAGLAYVCVSGPSEDYSKRAMEAVLNRFPADRLAIGGSCNPATSMTEADIKAYSGSTLHATYRL